MSAFFHVPTPAAMRIASAGFALVRGSPVMMKSAEGLMWLFERDLHLRATNVREKSSLKEKQSQRRPSSR
jgi:hypothetical protein